MTQNSVNSNTAHAYDIVVLSNGRINQSNTTMQTMGSAPAWTALTWAEGMALGNTEYATEWAASVGTANAFSSLTTTNGTTTASRATTNGTVTGTIVESAYFF